MKIQSFGALLLLGVVATVYSKPADTNLEDIYGSLDPNENIQNDNNDYPNYDDDDETDSTTNDSKNLSILTQEQEFIANEGETVDLPCHIVGNDLVQMWKKGDTLLFQAATSLRAPRNMQLKNQTLEISNLTRNDSGVYECVAMFDRQNQKSIKHTLKVNYRPVVEQIEARDTVLRIGDTLTLKCIAHGMPKPHISWHKDGERLGVEGDTLNIENVKHHNAGYYRCLADNKVGEPAHNQIEIKVEFKPIVTIEKISVSSDENQDTELKCIVHSEPRAQVLWKKDHRNIISSPHTVLSTDKHNHILLLKNLQDADFGEYTCSAVNYLGETKRNIKLVKTPAILGFKKPQADTKDVVLTWEVQSKTPISRHELGYRMRGEKHWKIINPKVEQSEADLYTVKYTLNGLEPGVYETRIRSENNNGWSGYSEIMPFEGVIAKTGHQHKHKNKHHKEKHTPEASTAKTMPDEVVPPAEHNEIETKDSAMFGASETSGNEGVVSSTTALVLSIVLGYCLRR